MTTDAMAALATEHANALALMRSLTPEEWAMPSDCDGWRVQDVFCHMASVFHQIADPGSMPEAGTDKAEEAAEVPIAARRGWTAQQVVDEYVEWSEKGIGALGGLQEPPMAEVVVPLGDLGSHPLHLLANAIVFDHYCHLRHDILQPSGPIDRPPLPEDDAALRATMTWMLAGLPQMCAAALPVVDRPVSLVMEGPGGGRWVLRPPADASSALVIEEGSDASAAATVTSTAHQFVSWGTKRRPWRDSGVRIEGDAAYAATILDAVNVI